VFEQLGSVEAEAIFTSHRGGAAGRGGKGHEEFRNGVFFFGQALGKAFPFSLQGERTAGIQHHNIGGSSCTQHARSDAADGYTKPFYIFFVGHLGPDGYDKVLVVVLNPVTGIIEQGHTAAVLDFAAKGADGIAEFALVEVGVVVYLKTCQREGIVHGIGIAAGRLAQRGELIVAVADHEGVSGLLRGERGTANQKQQKKGMSGHVTGEII